MWGAGLRFISWPRSFFVLTPLSVIYMAYVSKQTERAEQMDSALLERRKTARHVMAIMDEIDYLDMIIEPQDCGHKITTRNLLRDHVEAILKEMEHDK